MSMPQTGVNHDLARLEARFFGQLLDTLIAFVPLLLFSILAFALGLDDVVKGWVVILGLLFVIVYVLFADGMIRGQSWGKRILSMATVDERTGEPCSYGQSLVRNFSLVLLSIFDWIFIFGKSRQRLGDILAKTVVVYVSRQ